MTSQNSSVKNKTLTSPQIHNNVYGPKERNFFEEKTSSIKSYSKNDSATLSNHVIDPIVSNNISNAEFDYTYGDVLKTSTSKKTSKEDED